MVESKATVKGNCKEMPPGSFPMHDFSEHNGVIPINGMVCENLVGARTRALRLMPCQAELEGVYRESWNTNINPLFERDPANNLPSDTMFEPLVIGDLFPAPFVNERVGQTMFEQTPHNDTEGIKSMLISRESMVRAAFYSGHTLELPVRKLKNGSIIPMLPRIKPNPEINGNFYGYCNLPTTLGSQVKAANEALKNNTKPNTFMGKIMSFIAHALAGKKPEHEKFGTIWDTWD